MTRWERAAVEPLPKREDWELTLAPSLDMLRKPPRALTQAVSTAEESKVTFDWGTLVYLV